MSDAELRVAFLGAGYIARWHAEALALTRGQRLVAVCDPALAAAQALAHDFGAKAYAGWDEMLAAEDLQAVHILSPPPLHAAQSIAALQAGLHVLCEKPFALSPGEADAMLAAAAQSGRILAVNHNFLGLPGYQRLKRLLAEGALGPLDRVELRWHYPLPLLRSGPYGGWMLRAPQNLLQELGPHLFAFVQDLLGPLEDVTLRPGKWIDLPGGQRLPQVWQINGQAAGAEVSLSLSLVEGAEERSLSLRGVVGQAELDLGADRLIIERGNAGDLVWNPLRRELGLAGQHLREGMRNALRQAASLNRKQPYALGFAGVMQAFYGAIRKGEGIDPRFSAAAAVAVTGAIARTLQLLPTPTPSSAAPIAVLADVTAAPAIAATLAPPQALVIGGTGFIGRALVRALVAQGQSVRVLSRAGFNPFADLGPAVELVAAPMRDVAALEAAMRGMATVYHLARAEATSWQGYLDNDVAVTEGIARAAMAAGVRRLVYTGTIASYDASDPAQLITEATAFGPMEARNLYARSKALCEARLLAMHAQDGLPVTILRPGIVLGEGGPLQHWGIGRWHGAGAVRLWGKGDNPLPFVLVDDVAAGLIRAGLLPEGISGLEGESFNLIGLQQLSGRAYFAAIAALTGARIEVKSGRLRLMYLSDLVKYRLKHHVLRRQGLAYPSKADWLSRGHLSGFSGDKARQVLDWQPEADRARFLTRAIRYPGFFGF